MILLTTISSRSLREATNQLSYRFLHEAIRMGDTAMNTLPIEKKTLVLSLLAEGNSLRTISRVSGVA